MSFWNLFKVYFNSFFYHCIYRPDAKLVDIIVKDILKKLEKITIPINEKGLFGVNSWIMQVISLLDIKNPDFQIVGIWCMGGIGKTTIVEVVFRKVFKEFEGKFFMANVRERSKQVGLENLQKKIISCLLEENLKVGGFNIPEYIKDKLWRKKVFIILNDVNKLQQLEYLTGGLNRFGLRSRVVITTRNEEVLDKFKMEWIYEVEELNYYEAMKHFCNFAFRQRQHPKDQMVLLKAIVHFAKGNPLVLKVLDPFFYEKSRLDWEKADWIGKKH